MNEAGADTVRFMSKWGGLNWERIEPQKGVFDWSKTDEYYSEAIKNNLDIMVNIYPDNPEWDDPNNPYTMSVPVDMEAYLNFIKKTAERYPEITSWILGVELERGEEKKWWAGTPEEYADLFVKTSQTIKSVNPDAVVMTYGTNVYLNRKRGVIDTFTKPVLAEIKRLTKDSDDFSFFYAIHYYKTQDIALYIDILSYTQSMLDKYGFAEIPIIMTDMAPFFWNDEDLREQKLAKHLIKTYTVSFAHDLSNIVWAQLSDGYGYADGEQFEAGLITRDSQQPEGYYKNLGFYTYKLMVEKLEGSDWDNIQTIQESDNIYIYKFMKNGETVWVAWWDYFDDSGTRKTITLDVGDRDAVKITEAVPDAEDGSKIDENDYPNFFKTEAKTTSGGRVEITLGESPVFIEVIEGEEPEEKSCSELSGTICSSSQTCSGSWLDASDSERCCSGECESAVIDYEDSPFGFIQGEVVYGQRPDATFLIDLGVHWNKVAAKNGIRFPSKNINDINFDTEVDFTELDKYVKEIFVDNGIYMSIPLLTFVKINNKEVLLTHDQYRELNTVLIERYNGDGVDDMEGSPKVKYCFVAGSEMNTGIGKGQNINKRKWKLSEADTAEYVKIGYDLIKSFDSEFKVLLGGSNSICTWQKDTPCIWREEPEPDEFYYNLISEMTGDNFCPDMIFDYHHGSSPTQFKSQIKAMNIVKETLSEFGYEDNDIWTTDVGGSWDGLDGFTEIEQSGDVVRRYVYTIANGQEKLFWTRIEEYHWTSDDSSIFDHMGLINNPANADCKDWKKLSYYTYKLMVEKLEGSDWDNIQTIQESDNVYIYKFMKNGDPVWVAWWDYFDDSGSSKIITIDVGDINSVKITEAVPKYETGQEVTDYSTAFNTETKTVSDGQVTITLGESPVFVEKR